MQITDEPEDQPVEWPPAWSQELTDAALQRASSKAIFKRGQTYAASGAVDVLAEDSLPEPSLSAHVTGTELYTTELWIEDNVLTGRCDCPNAEDGWFCKHQVAVALVWRDRLASTIPAVDDSARKKVEATVKRARTVKDKRQALHDFLHSRPTKSLADKLLEFADLEHDIARELHQWRKLSELPSEAPDLKPLIGDILSPGRSFIAWNESYSYVRRAEAVLPLLQQARERGAADAVPLCVHGLRRAWGVLAQADDSNGDIGGLCEAIGGQLVQSLQAAGPQPAGFGDTYLQLQLDDPFGCFDAKAAEAAMGQTALGRYREALEQRWRLAKNAVLEFKAERAARAAKATAWKARSIILDKPPADSEAERRLWTLERLHLAQLEGMGAIDAALAVLREDLSDAHAHSQVVSFLEKHGRHREAFAQAELGSKAFPDDWRLQDDLLRCYERDGWTTEALALRRRQFDARPSVERYHQVLKAGKAAGVDSRTLRKALFEKIQANEEEEHERRRKSPATPMWQRGLPTPARQDVTLRAEILCSEDRWTEACALVQQPMACRDTVLQQIATHLPEDHRDQALQLLLRVFDAVIAQSSSPYREALVLVAEIGQRMSAGQRVAWLTQLRIDYKAKRNFVRDLPLR